MQKEVNCHCLTLAIWYIECSMEHPGNYKSTRLDKSYYSRLCLACAGKELSSFTLNGWVGGALVCFPEHALFVYFT